MADSSKAQQIRDLLAQDRPLVMGGVYDGLSTRIAHRAGFEVLFMGGFSVAATMLGEPDFGYLTQTEMADAARRLCRLTARPMLVDADTGYGNALNVLRTVELYHAAGAAGSFQQHRLNAQLAQAERASEATDPGADDHCFVYVPHNL